MPYKRSDFIPFSADSGRVASNLEGAYEQWLDARRELASLPISMFWQSKSGVDYLAVKDRSNDPGTTIGPRSAETESQYEAHHAAKEAAKARIKAADALIGERAALYRALRLPAIPDRQAEIIRALDIEQLLRNDLLVVGTNAFIGYELLCNAKFPVGVEETEDFDLAWCRDSRVSLASITGVDSDAVGARRSLFSVLQSVDSTFSLNRRKPYQAVNADGYEVELLIAPSLAPLPRSEIFEPMLTLVEQEWLLRGRPLSTVVATVRQRACPLYAPDPRWMALHKLWLSEKPERNALKKPKDRRQGEVLLSACRYFLADSHPMDVDFVLDLPEELRDHFNAWASANEFDPMDPSRAPSFDSVSVEPRRRGRARP